MTANAAAAGSATRKAIVDAGRDLFGERGYSAVTIKDVAVRAGFSPAMVMKVMGSKAELYSAAAPEGPNVDDPGSAEPVGYQLVRRIVTRRDQREAEPWAMLPILIHDAPDPDAARVTFRNRYVSRIAERIGDTEPGLRRTKLVVCALLGLGAGVRTLGVLGPGEVGGEALIREYGALVQGIIDGSV
ncbi:TetR family transcriptional regulator [Paeniglutamicibacter antarcticus]|uniref:TetR family transcriptional regulator n=1 Tax=Arthrobacter terrae TaxID=2935737 RepID=A0A931CPR0_9MICC|nr:TetR/AcrR family transcriptional regulator [Arthrobacter terrae]MBG0740777.1 TetR family transcriptional regulator [Arthrobacter terrae]